MSKVKDLSQPIGMTFAEMSQLIEFHGKVAAGSEYVGYFGPSEAQIADRCSYHAARLIELNAIRKSMILEDKTEEVA